MQPFPVAEIFYSSRKQSKYVSNTQAVRNSSTVLRNFESMGKRGRDDVVLIASNSFFHGASAGNRRIWESKDEKQIGFLN